MMYDKELQELNERLSDFQKATVDYLDHRLYDDGQNRMLVADEVGLGKTWIAKGVIAKAYERWCKSTDNGGKKHFNIYYICSNQQLISQNLKNINFTQDTRCIVSQVSRISLLARKPEYKDVPIHIYALTPDTSFSQRSSQGIKEERYILYAILETEFADHRYRKHLSSLLKGSDSRIDWDESALNINRWREKLRSEFGAEYVSALNNFVVTEALLPTCYRQYDLVGNLSLWNIIVRVVELFDRRSASSSIYYELIGLMRKIMTDVCLKLMDADIFVMDEFQRYSQLIDAKEESEQATIAQKVFGQNRAKVLMLSATPFKAFTNQYDEQHDEQHYKELKRVLKFLYEGTSVDWKSYEEARGRMFSLILKLKESTQREGLLHEIEYIKRTVEDLYAKVIVRTEKIIASNDPNAMIINAEDKPLPITRQGIEDFIRLDTVFRSIYERQKEKAPSPIDYAKSAPYAMSFLRDYKVGEKAIKSNLTLPRNAFVDLNEINKYVFPQNSHWPNEKLHILMKNMRQEARLLWCPPSLPYYPLEGAFRGQQNFTKTLVFSGWKLVPKMIATLVSYEAEKQSLGRLDSKEGIKYFTDKRVASQGDKARKPYRKLVFTKDKNNTTTLLLAYPSRTLAKYIDPIELINSTGKINSIVKNRVPEVVDRLKAFCNEGGTIEDRETTHISWAYPILCDRQEDNSWIDINISKMGQDDKESMLTSKYIPELKDYLSGNVKPDYPKKLSQQELYRQAELMILMSLGSPGICAFRALKRYYGECKEVLVAAFQIGLAFIDLFNKPESIAVVDLQYPQKLDYWQKVVRYCVDGNLQAVLDEYIFMLKNDYKNVSELSVAMCNVLSIRTTRLKVDDASSFSKEDSEDMDVRHTMRSHYAAAFGVNPKSNQGSETRATNIREAFNSPFRPFVLATTSIGQEGLDFHWYCRRIVHWNLPNNPIDFEQREGRINRFRGKVIRQRVADRYGNKIGQIERPWDALFEMAKADKVNAKFPCDIVPNWHFDSTAVSIERIVPLYQFSQDIQRYADMLHVLGLYRLTFGQPRQEELAEALDCELTDDEMNKLLIDLCPMRRIYKQKEHNNSKS